MRSRMVGRDMLPPARRESLRRLLLGGSLQDAALRMFGWLAVASAVAAMIGWLVL